jgi:hydrogenase maturation protease
MSRILVAGLGNIFFGDDAFGVEVVRELRSRALPAEVKVLDIGIRAVDLTFALQDGWDLAILVDATQRGKPPGTLCVLDLQAASILPSAVVLDGHGLHPDGVLAAARAGGAPIGQLRLVGCEPESLGESPSSPALGLSQTVANAVPPAVALVEQMIREHLQQERAWTVM